MKSPYLKIVLDKLWNIGYRVHIMNYLTPEEILSVLRVARAESMRDFLMILLAYRHGLRANEVTSLRITDIRDGAIDIKRSKNSLRTVQPLESFRGENLLNEKVGVSAWLKAGNRPTDAGDALFPSAKGGTLRPNSFNVIFKKYARKAGLPPDKDNPHILKHSCASHLVRANVNLAVVQQRLGHASISSTQKYVHLNDLEVAEKTASAMYEVFK